MYRELYDFKKLEYERLAAISVSHLYNEEPLWVVTSAVVRTLAGIPIETGTGEGVRWSLSIGGPRPEVNSAKASFTINGRRPRPSSRAHSS